MFGFYSLSFYLGPSYILLSRALFRASYSLYFVACSQLILRYYERACASVMVLGFALIVMSNYIITALSSAISVIANSGLSKKEYLQSRLVMLFVLLFAVLANLRIKRKLEDDEIQVDDTLKFVPQLVVDEDADDSDIFARPQMSPFSSSLLTEKSRTT